MSLEQERLEERPSLATQSLATLAGEILRDAQKLFDQQVTLTKLQLLENWASAKPFALWLTVGLMALAAASVLLALTLVYVLNELTELRLWACFASVALGFLLVTLTSFAIAHSKLKGMSVLNGQKNRAANGGDC